MNVGGTDVNVDSRQYDSLRISELRKRAYENGHNVDGWIERDAHCGS